MKIDIIIQGGLWNKTVDSAVYYKELDFVNKVIISTWEDDPKLMSAENLFNSANLEENNIVLLKNKKPSYIGPGNLNLHLGSARTALEICESDVVLKIRSDEKMSHEGLATWAHFFKEHENEETLKYLDGTQQRTKVHVIATNVNYPYHPQDHVFIGYKQDLHRIFNMPFSHEPLLMPEPIDFSIRTGHLRNPIYIGAHYFAMFFEEARHHLDNWKEFLLDEAPHRDEAMKFYLENRNSIFRPLPVIDMWWEKFNSQYWWEGYRRGGDRYACEESESR